MIIYWQIRTVFILQKYNILLPLEIKRCYFDA